MSQCSPLHSGPSIEGDGNKYYLGPLSLDILLGSSVLHVTDAKQKYSHSYEKIAVHYVNALSLSVPYKVCKLMFLNLKCLFYKRFVLYYVFPPLAGRAAVCGEPDGAAAAHHGHRHHRRQPQLRQQ